MIICPVCGEANGDSSLYCQSCAARLNVGAGSAVPEHKSNSSYTRRHNVGAAPSFHSGNSSGVPGPSVKNVQSLFSRYHAGDSYNTRYADILHVIAIVLLAINIVAGVLSFFLTLDDAPVLSFVLLVSLGLSAAISYFSLELFSSMYRNIALTGRNTEVLCYAIQSQTDNLHKLSGILGGIAQSQNAMTEALRNEISANNVSADVAACTQALEQLPQSLAEMLAPIITESVAAVAAGIPDAVRLAVRAQAAESTEDESEDKSEANDEPAAAAKDAPDAKDDRDSEAEPEPASVKVPVRQVGQTSSQRPRQVSAQQSSRNANQQSSTQQNTAQEPLPSAAPAAPALPSDDEDEEPVIVLYDPDLDPEPIPTPEPQPGDVPLDTLIGPGGEL